MLLEVNIDKLQKSTDFLDWKKDPSTHSEDYDQLKKDADRSFYSIQSYRDMEPHYLYSRPDSERRSSRTCSKSWTPSRRTSPNTSIFKGSTT